MRIGSNSLLGRRKRERPKTWIAPAATVSRGSESGGSESKGTPGRGNESTTPIRRSASMNCSSVLPAGGSTPRSIASK